MRLTLLFWVLTQVLWAQNPVALSVAADDPDDNDSYESVYDIITISFSLPTNQPAAATKAQIDGLMTFSASVGSNYTGVWADNQTLVITIQNNAGNGNPTPGVTSVTFNVGAGGIKDATGVFAVLPGPVILTGDWGLGSPNPYFGGQKSGDTIAVYNNPLTCSSFFGGQKSGDTIAVYNNPLTCSSFFGGVRSGDTIAVYNNPLACVPFWGGAGQGYDTTVFINPKTCTSFFGSAGDGDDVGVTSSICVMYFGAAGAGDVSEDFINPIGCSSYFAGASAGFSADTSGCKDVYLPIIASPLFAVWENDKAKVFWKIFYQENVSSYEVQKSRETTRWEKLTVLLPLQGNAPWSYVTFDEQPFPGITYYRFITHDTDGKTTISNIASLQSDFDRWGQLSIYPNPLSSAELQSTIIARQGAIVSLNVMNTLGETVLSSSQALNIGTNHLRWNLESCAKGVYILVFQWDNFQQSVRLIKN